MGQTQSSPLAALQPVTLHIAEFCGWKERVALRLTCRNVFSDDDHELVWWRFLCERLVDEPCLYFQHPSKDQELSLKWWHSRFRTLWPLRNRFLVRIVPKTDQEVEDEAMNILCGQKISDNIEKEEFKIDVYVRFKGGVERQNPAGATAHHVVLPLHQKVALLKQQHPGIVHDEALKAVIRERGQVPLGDTGDAFQNSNCKAKQKVTKVKPEEVFAVDDSADGGGGGEEEKCNIKAQILNVAGNTVLSVVPGVGLREFAFNAVYDGKASQVEVYESNVRELVADFLNGSHASIICYGQTAAGKTYTMFGPPELQGCSRKLEGIANRAGREVMKELETKAKTMEHCTLQFSYVEVYGNEVNDLLDSGNIVGQDREGRYAGTRATDRVGHRYVLDGNTAVPCESYADFERLLMEGDGAKRRAATLMNERSTRAHTFLILTLTQRKKRPGLHLIKKEDMPRHGDNYYDTVVSKLVMADLGGAERMSKSKADDELKSKVIVVGDQEETRIGWNEYYHHRKRVQETLLINRGLLALKRVIQALNDRVRLRDPNIYVPYPESKVTQLLQSSLGGESRCCIICCCSSEQWNAMESVHTLRFAESCSHIAIQKQMKDETGAVKRAMAKVEEDIAILEEEIKKKERWETVKVKRTDVHGLVYAGDELEEVEELVPKTMLVGAEEERKKLEEALQKRNDILNLQADMGKDFRAMTYQDEEVKGQKDFRHAARFGKHMKARDFEDTVVVADALRFLFRKTDFATKYCGETDDTIRKRLDIENIPKKYIEIAEKMKKRYEQQVQEGQVDVSFGKATMDRILGWQKELKDQTDDLLTINAESRDKENDSPNLLPVKDPATFTDATIKVSRRNDIIAGLDSELADVILEEDEPDEI